MIRLNVDVDVDMEWPGKFCCQIEPVSIAKQLARQAWQSFCDIVLAGNWAKIDGPKAASQTTTQVPLQVATSADRRRK